jgi:hypothetical protein
MRRLRFSAIVLVVMWLAVGAASASASTESPVPWWGITAGSHPTDLRSGVGKDEVQKVTVSKATGGEFALLNVAKYLTTKKGFALLRWDATAAEVQKGLEGDYGEGDVHVSGGPGATPPAPGEQSWSYLVTFTGSFADQPVPPVFADAEAKPFGGTANLEGAENAVSVEVVTQGTSDGQLVIEAQNLGDASANGCSAVPAGAGKYRDAACSEPAGPATEGVFEKTPITITDTLPKGLTAVSAEDGEGAVTPASRGTCEVESSGRRVTCTVDGGVPAYEQIEVLIAVHIEPSAKTGEVNTATVSGGGAAGARTATHTIEVNGSERFGTESYTIVPENMGGSVDTQAGSHPFQVTTVVNANSAPSLLAGGVQFGGAAASTPRTVALAKDNISQLPAGLVGNPTPFAQCTDAQFNTVQNGFTSCPAASAIGVALLRYSSPDLNEAFRTPIFNMTPLPGEPARFGFHSGPVPVFLNASVRTGSDYGVTISSHNLIQLVWLESAKLTFWGVPGSSLHDRQRGTECLKEFGSCPPSTATAPPPFLVMPTSCQSPWVSTLDADSWPYEEHASEQGEQIRYELPEKLDGCNHLPFAPTLTVAPDVANGSSPSGLTVGVHVPQSASLNPEGLAESTLRNTTVTLPEGVTLNPAGADGLEACSEAQIGYTGLEATSATDLFTPGLPEPFCSNASKIATVKIKTPLLPNALEGAVYLASPAPQGEAGRNPFNSLIAMYIVAQDPVSGVLVKLPGEVKPNPVTGQLVAMFENTPELPFEELELHFFGGDRAPLGSPPHCGSYTTNATFAPWSGNEAVNPSSTFEITSGPNGSPCQNPLPFAPSLTAGTTSIQAGGFSPFTMTMSREDGNQNLNSVQLKMPPGLLGTLSTVKLCGEPQADEGTCGPESEIGHTVVSVGLGGSPFTVTGGEVFITGPYRGAPYGLSIVNPADAGPFNLGKVVVRAKIEVDPTTAALTITTDETGPYKIPTIIDGIPLEIKHINVSIDRPNFTFNPTNCSPLAITGSLTSSEGASDALSVPFQATNCAVLAFKPKLEATTSGRTSRANGASLTVKLGYPAGPYDANIAKVKVELPKALPSRLTTLQKACTAAVFESNPAACPAASIVGHATASTPVLPVPLSGPAYFVSHGGEAFPSLVIVLQGYGTTVHLVGSTFINEKTGITSSTFKTVPDVPVGAFELTLPQGPYSALTATTNLCEKSLAMPTEFIAQNGATLEQSTPITVTGCAKHKHKAKKHKARKKTKRSKARHSTRAGRKRKG